LFRHCLYYDVAEYLRYGGRDLGRRNQGLSQRELARRAGLSAAYVSEIESGRKAPTLTTLRSLASGLGVPTEALLSPSPVELVGPAPGPTSGAAGPGNGDAPSPPAGDCPSPAAGGYPSPTAGEQSGPAAGERQSPSTGGNGLSWGDRLRLARQARGRTLAETARRAGLSPSYLGDIEIGRASCRERV